MIARICAFLCVPFIIIFYGSVCMYVCAFFYERVRGCVYAYLFTHVRELRERLGACVPACVCACVFVVWVFA